MNHFISNDDVPGRLYDLISEVIDRREHAGNKTARNTAAINVKVFPRIDFVRKMLSGTEAASQALNKLLSFRSHRRNPSIRWVDNQRGLSVRLLPFLPV